MGVMVSTLISCTYLGSVKHPMSYWSTASRGTAGTSWV